MAYTVNDRRHANASPATPDELALDGSPEKMWKTTVATIRDYMRNRAPDTLRAFDASKPSIKSNSPTRDALARMDREEVAKTAPAQNALANETVVEELARYIVQALLHARDPRPWVMRKASDLVVGDVFVLYEFVNGKPDDQEVSVSAPVKVAGTRAEIRIGRPDGKLDKYVANVDYLFYVHRPKHTLDELDDELQAVE